MFPFIDTAPRAARPAIVLSIIAANVIVFLWMWGPAMEARLGRFWFAVMYVGGAFAASLVHVITHPDSTDPVLGASGAIAAVIAAYAMTYPSARVITILPIFFI